MTLRTRAPLGLTLTALALAACHDPTGSVGAGPRQPPAAREALSTAPTGRLAVSPEFDRLVVDRIDPPALSGVGASTAACTMALSISEQWLSHVRPFFDADNGVQYSALLAISADVILAYEAELFESEATPQSYGYTGEFTQALVKTEKDIKRFWDIPSARIEMVAMHGSTLLDVPKVARTYQRVFSLSETEATARATYIRDVVVGSPLLNGGNSPLFTFNGIAFPPGWGGAGAAPKIVMGDSYLEAWAAVGLGDVAPQAIFAHEFGHQVQYARNYFADAYANVGTASERTRYTEMMADAFSGYFLTHARGAAMNQKRVELFLEQAFRIGDCYFDSPYHHGTPTQRMAASRFGFTLADEAQKQGLILTAEEFHARFVAAYPTLLDPAAP